MAGSGSGSGSGSGCFCFCFCFCCATLPAAAACAESSPPLARLLLRCRFDFLPFLLVDLLPAAHGCFVWSLTSCVLATLAAEPMATAVANDSRGRCHLLCWNLPCVVKGPVTDWTQAQGVYTSQTSYYSAYIPAHTPHSSGAHGCAIDCCCITVFASALGYIQVVACLLTFVFLEVGSACGTQVKNMQCEHMSCKTLPTMHRPRAFVWLLVVASMLLVTSAACHGDADNDNSEAPKLSSSGGCCSS